MRNRADRTDPGEWIGVGPITYSDTDWADFLPAPVRRKTLKGLVIWAL
jgi:hypothetical protein